MPRKRPNDDELASASKMLKICKDAILPAQLDGTIGEARGDELSPASAKFKPAQSFFPFPRVRQIEWILKNTQKDKTRPSFSKGELMFCKADGGAFLFCSSSIKTSPKQNARQELLYIGDSICIKQSVNTALKRFFKSNGTEIYPCATRSRNRNTGIRETVYYVPDDTLKVMGIEDEGIHYVDLSDLQDVITKQYHKYILDLGPDVEKASFILGVADAISESDVGDFPAIVDEMFLSYNASYADSLEGPEGAESRSRM